ncbi:MAG: hypothetical protein HON27_02625 [Candidatus Marinimicrobia bacterium]|nr:hypothetical protein [Candidatus Neomarinimicrobiota bacterium]MBT5268729.1 hypothetical protein [Candidatus Neomarinimicrobiota bacterium]MBT6010288.1 hypothetical protein [Candidatus Neomarinimicrobiota bacterium]
MLKWQDAGKVSPERDGFYLLKLELPKYGENWDGPGDQPCVYPICLELVWLDYDDEGNAQVDADLEGTYGDGVGWGEVMEWIAIEDYVDFSTPDS